MAKDTHTFVSFADLDTGKPVGAILLAGNIDIETYQVPESETKSMQVNRFHTTAEMDAKGYDRETVQR